MKRDLRTDRGYDRMVNFSDAIVAIAITLLVLPLIDLLDDETTTTFAELLSKNWGSFLAFAAAFLTTALYWSFHHRTFELIGNYDATVLWLNVVWLMLIVLLPFISASFSSYPETDPGSISLTFVVFCLDLALLSLVLGAISRYAATRPDLLANGVVPEDMRTHRAWTYGIFFGLLAATVAFIDWRFGAVGYNVAWGFVLLYPLGLVTDWMDKRIEPKAIAAAERKAAAESSSD